jgi:heme oxygenase
LFRHLANVLPGEAAFAASYLKIYGGATGEMWKSFAEGLDRAAASEPHLEMIVAGATAGCRHFRRWRSVLDGKSVTNPPQGMSTTEKS